MPGLTELSVQEILNRCFDENNNRLRTDIRDITVPSGDVSPGLAITPQDTYPGLRVYNPGSGGLEHINVLWDGNVAYIKTTKSAGGSDRSLLLGSSAAGNMLSLNSSGGIALYPTGTNSLLHYPANVAAGFLTASFIGLSNYTEGQTGRLNRRTVRGLSAAMSGASVTITVDIPSGAKLLGAQFTVNTAITSDSGASWAAAYSGGSTASLGSGIAFDVNTKKNTLIVPAIATDVTQIVLTPNAGAFTAGVVECVAYYEDMTNMANV